MQRPFEKPIRRSRVEAQLFPPDADCQPKGIEGLPPLLSGPVIIGEHNAVARIANPIHEAQREAGQESIKGMIFNYNGFAGHPHRFAEKDHRVLRVVKHIDKHHHVKACISIGNHLAVEPVDRDMRSARGLRHRSL